MICPKCGRQTAEGAFCERCGAPLASANNRIRQVETRIDHEVADESLLARQRGEPTLEYDRTCPLFENMSGIIRLRFDPKGGGGRVENVTIAFSNPDCARQPVLNIRHADRRRECLVQFPPQAVGLQSWDIRLNYDSERRKHELTGQLQVLVKPVESRKRGADNFNISIQTNVGNVGNASDVTVNQRGVEGLEKLVAAADPFEEMDRLMASDERDWVPVPLSDDNKVVSLPQMPMAARTDCLVLEYGGKRLRLFAGRTVRFGRAKERNDIALRPAAGCSEADMVAYRVVSREHCLFEHSGTQAAIIDGGRDEAGVVRPSSGGTYWNDERIKGPLSLSAGDGGVVSFGGPACARGLSMDVKVCSPAKACQTCPHSNIHWCGEGKRSSLLLARRDGVHERFAAVWSCFCLGEADPSFEGTVIFRKDGAFAYRREDGRSGWLVPGATIQSDLGPVCVSLPNNYQPPTTNY